MTMKKALSANNPKNGARGLARTLCVGLLLAGVALVPTLSPFAQKRKDAPYTVTGVSSSQAGGATVVSVSADAPMTRTQTWQDEEGFHMSLPGATPGALKGLPKGVTVRNLGKSLEVVVAVKPGSGVTVDPQSNRLNLVIRGGLDTTKGEAQLSAPQTSPRAAESAETSADYEPPTRGRRPLAEAPPVHNSPQQGQNYGQAAGQTGQAANGFPNAAAPAASPFASPLAAASPAATPVQLVPPTDPGIVPAGSQPAQQPAQAPAVLTVSNEESGGLLSYLFSLPGVIVLLLIGGLSLVLARRQQNRKDVAEEKEEKSETEAVALVAAGELTAIEERPKKERRRRSRRQSDQSLARRSGADTPAAAASDSEHGHEDGLEKRPAGAPVTPALYGAYRVDQEVGKLVLGQAHRLDVLSSRAPGHPPAPDK